MFLGAKGVGNTSGIVSATPSTQTVVPGSSQPSTQSAKDKEALSVCSLVTLSSLSFISLSFILCLSHV